MLLALPSLIPGVNVPAAPLGGGAIMTLGWQMLRGKEHPWVPARAQRMELHPGRIKEALARLEGMLGTLGWDRLERRPLSKRWMGLLVLWTGLLLAVPVPLPFGNILPAGALCLQGSALLEERPVLGWIGVALALGITAYFALSADLLLREAHHALVWAMGKFA